MRESIPVWRAFIKRCGKHLQRLIDEIIDMSKIEADEMKLEIIGVLVKDLVVSSLLLFHYITTCESVLLDLRSYHIPNRP